MAQHGLMYRGRSAINHHKIGIIVLVEGFERATFSALPAEQIDQIGRTQYVNKLEEQKVVIEF